MSTTLERVGVLVNPRLLAELDLLYPHRAPRIEDSEREIWMKAGERRLADFLTAAHKAATETVLTGES